MPYYVRWQQRGQDHVIKHDIPFPTPSEAMDFACAVLAHGPDDVWVENARGEKIALDLKIRQHCKDRGFP